MYWHWKQYNGREETGVNKTKCWTIIAHSSEDVKSWYKLKLKIIGSSFYKTVKNNTDIWKLIIQMFDES